MARSNRKRSKDRPRRDQGSGGATAAATPGRRSLGPAPDRRSAPGLSAARPDADQRELEGSETEPELQHAPLERGPRERPGAEGDADGNGRVPGGIDADAQLGASAVSDGAAELPADEAYDDGVGEAYDDGGEEAYGDGVGEAYGYGTGEAHGHEDEEDDDDGQLDPSALAPGAPAAPRARRGRSAVTAAHPAPREADHENLATRTARFLQGSWRELQRVQWPDRRQVMQATGVVIGFVIVAGVILGVSDLISEKIVNFIINH